MPYAPTTGDRLLAAWLSLTSTLWNKRLVSTLTYNEAHVLGILLRAEDTGRACTATTLIAQTRLLKSQMNKVLTTLEGKGFLLRMRSEADKRVILIHLIFDLIYFIGLDLHLPAWYVFIQQYGGVIFVVLSGCCATLGSRSFRRGCIVFACGMLISLVTFGMYRLGMASRDVIVWFGVLHLLGICMMLYPAYKKLPTQALAAMGIVLVVTGYLISGTVVEAKFLFPFGFVYEGFASSDYFPLLPHRGWYMLGTVLGRTVYADKKTRLPGTFRESAIARFFCWCGRQSLFIYLLHQPIVYGLLELIAALRR